MKEQRYYQIVRNLILNLLKSRELLPGDRLPSERDLCQQTGQNRNTVRHALLMLQREGLLFRLDRKGWYVNPIRLVYNPANHVNFARLAASQGREASWTTSDKGILVADDGNDAGGEDGFPSGTEVYFMENVFFLDGQKVACTRNYLNAGRLPGIVPLTAEQAMTQVVEKEYGITLVQTNLLIRPQLLPRDVSLELGISHGSPGIYVRRTKTDGKGTVLTVEYEFWRFDAIELRVSQ